jgi:hypothetical protein
MPTEADRPETRVNPRPGVVKTLGIFNIVFSVLSGFAIFASAIWWIAARTSGSTAPPTKVVDPAGPSNTTVVAINPFMGMDEPRAVRFSLVENCVSLITTSLMFATGIGLLNLRRWAARWWTYLAWAKIALVVLLWGYYIVAVAPALSENMARNVAVMIPKSGGRGGGPTVAQLTMIYSVMNLVVAVVVILVSSIYPAISLWLLSRPGVKAALIDKPEKEPELP